MAAAGNPGLLQQPQFHQGYVSSQYGYVTYVPSIPAGPTGGAMMAMSEGYYAEPYNSAILRYMIAPGGGAIMGVDSATARNAPSQTQVFPAGVTSNMMQESPHSAVAMRSSNNIQGDNGISQRNQLVAHTHQTERRVSNSESRMARLSSSSDSSVATNQSSSSGSPHPYVAHPAYAPRIIYARSSHDFSTQNAPLQIPHQIPGLQVPPQHGHGTAVPPPMVSQTPPNVPEDLTTLPDNREHEGGSTAHPNQQPLLPTPAINPDSCHEDPASSKIVSPQPTHTDDNNTDGANVRRRRRRVSGGGSDRLSSEPADAASNEAESNAAKESPTSCSTVMNDVTAGEVFQGASTSDGSNPSVLEADFDTALEEAKKKIMSTSFDSSIRSEPLELRVADSKRQRRRSRDPSQSYGSLSAEASSVDQPTAWTLPGHINPAKFVCDPPNARYFVIKSYSEEDVYRAIKDELWTSTETGNAKLDKAFQELRGQGPLFLLFSVNASGHFCGVAEMKSPFNESATSNAWKHDRWKGEFKVRWHLVKDVPNRLLKHFRNPWNDNKAVPQSRDTQELPPDLGSAVLSVLHEYRAEYSIIDAFAQYEQPTSRSTVSDAAAQRQAQRPSKPRRRRPTQRR